MFAVEQQDQRSTDPQPQLLLLCADLHGMAWRGTATEQAPLGQKIFDRIKSVHGIGFLPITYLRLPT